MHGCVANDAGMSHKDAHRRRICRPNIPAGSPVGNGRKWYMSIITNHHSTSHPLDRIGSDHREMDTTRTWLHYCRWTLSESGHKASRCSWSVVITNQWPPPIRIHSSIFLSSLLCRCCTMPMHASPGRWWSIYFRVNEFVSVFVFLQKSEKFSLSFHPYWWTMNTCLFSH